MDKFRSPPWFQIFPSILRILCAQQPSSRILHVYVYAYTHMYVYLSMWLIVGKERRNFFSAVRGCPRSCARTNPWFRSQILGGKRAQEPPPGSAVKHCWFLGTGGTYLAPGPPSSRRAPTPSVTGIGYLLECKPDTCEALEYLHPAGGGRGPASPTAVARNSASSSTSLASSVGSSGSGLCQGRPVLTAPRAQGTGRGRTLPMRRGGERRGRGCCGVVGGTRPQTP